VPDLQVLSCYRPTREADPTERPTLLMTAEPTPAMARRELANLLRELRRARDLGLEAVAAAIDLTPGFLSRVERGLRGVGDENAERLSDFYELPARSRDRVRQLAQLARETTWWEKGPMQRATREYVGFEQAATAIMSFGSIVHGLLQTRAYCEAMVGRTAIADPDGYIATTIENRLRRQEVLDRPDPPWIWVILDESSLHRAIGGPATMRNQLAALVAAAGRTRTSVRILPFSAGAHPGMDSRFTMVSTRSDHGPELVHVEGLSGARNLFGDKDLAKYAEAWQALAALALPDEDSTNLIGRIARDIGGPDAEGYNVAR
jgi:transcriptional regulator with XRE-family HTH domain